MKALLATLTAITIAMMSSSQAYALSCASNGFDLETHFKTNKKTGKKITYVKGHFSGGSKSKATPNFRGTGINGGIKLVPQNGKATKTIVNFSGKRMTRSGEKAFRTKVIVQTSCLSVWCGKVPQNSQQTLRQEV